MSDPQTQAPPLVTVMVSVREGYSHAEASLRSVLAQDDVAFELVYLDILTPPRIAASVRALVEARGGRVIRHDAWIAPAAARKQAVGGVRTKYVLFVDNDVLVEAGCFARLLACAEETGAALTGPLYLQAGEGGALAIHMAGGVFHRDAEGALVAGEHRLAMGGVAEAAGLERAPVGFVEYHTMLARTDLVRAADAISDDVLLMDEHMDLALKAEAAGFSVWSEPAARVTYLRGVERRLGDIDCQRRRWDLVACEASMAAFERRWRPADPEGFHAGVRIFLAERRGHMSLRRIGAEACAATAAMAPPALAQTRLALREQAAARGYGERDRRALEAAGDFATLIFDRLYRPDGRPFLNHALGTASALVAYDARIEVVLAGLLHAAYTHRPEWIEEAEVTRLLASGGAAELIVRALPRAKALLAAADGGAAPPAADLTLLDAEALAVEAANEADMRLAGEYRACGRPPMISASGLALLGEVLGIVDLPALAQSAAVAMGDMAPAPILGFDALHGSFRLDAPARRLDPVRPRA